MTITIALWPYHDEDRFEVRGAMDFAAAPRLRQVIFDRLDRGRRHIVIDLTHVRLIDAGAIRVLLYLQQRAEQRGGSLRTPGARGAARTALEIAGAAKQLGAHEDVTFGDGPYESLATGPITTGWPPAVTDDLIRLHAAAHSPAQHRRLRTTIIETCMPAAQRLAHRYTRSTEPMADLEQVAYLGLIKAVDGFDPGRLIEFGPYAVAMVTGELKRHFRDRAWTVRVPRRLQDHWQAINHAWDELTARLGHPPTARDLAGRLGIDVEEAAEALEVGRTYRPLSLDLPAHANQVESATLLDHLGAEDPDLDGVDNHESLHVIMTGLPERAQRVLALRFYGGLTQHEIAARLGLSQMQISRILRQSLATLRRRLEES
ncbi:SigB/SigF/SigG family RNA polymerase sigma factor [Dactylosporangium sp. NPDC051541]|uniref:SigB/SigF/SigG family RNA polymerase sigma factor n=1 Tax=Dactylosporangium sp. NPDC051541 TaxID=3363977 RepID=UPI00379CD7D3